MADEVARVAVGLTDESPRQAGKRYDTLSWEFSLWWAALWQKQYTQGGFPSFADKTRLGLAMTAKSVAVATESIAMDTPNAAAVTPLPRFFSPVLH